MELARLVGKQSGKEIFANLKNKNKLIMHSKLKTKNNSPKLSLKECQSHPNISVMMSPSINLNPLITSKPKIKPLKS